MGLVLAELDNTCNSYYMDLNFKIPISTAIFYGLKLWDQNIFVAFGNDYPVKARTHKVPFCYFVATFCFYYYVIIQHLICILITWPTYMSCDFSSKMPEKNKAFWNEENMLLYEFSFHNDLKINVPSSSFFCLEINVFISQRFITTALTMYSLLFCIPAFFC